MVTSVQRGDTSSFQGLPATDSSPAQATASSSTATRSNLGSADPQMPGAFERRRSSSSSERAPRARLPVDARRAQAEDAKHPNLQKSDLRPGDVWLWVNEPDPSHPKVAQVVHSTILRGQQLEGLMDPGNTGDPNLCHAGLWTKNPGNPGQTAPMGHGEPEVVEASGGNARVQGTAISAGLYKVFRPKDENHGDWAAQVAMGFADKREIPYSKTDAAAALFKSSSFGPAAQQGADKYAQAAFAEHPDGIDGAFCSMLVAASYQGAAQHIGLPADAAMPVDAMATSVRTLEHTMKSDPNAFSLMGHLRVNPQDVLFNELPPGATPRPARTQPAPPDAIDQAAFMPGAFESGRDRTHQAIGALSTDARRLLQISAVAGEGMSAALVGRLSPSVAQQMPALAAELQNAGLWSNGRPSHPEVVACVRENMAPELHSLLSGAIDIHR